MSRHYSLSTADLSKFELRRDFLRDPAAATVAYTQAYDRTTLWYDAFWRDGRVIVVCPNLINFKPLIKEAQFKLDGQPTKIARLRHYTRHDIIEFERSNRPDEISVVGDGFEVATPVNRANLDRFAGMNTLFTMSRNNDPAWIRDSALFHRKTQGLQAMVLIDNGSDQYSLSDIEDALDDAGLNDFIVVSAPLPYGRTPSVRAEHTAKFLQRSLMNITRLRFLGHARAVLNVDIDELVWSDGASVFDKTVNSRLGFLSFGGEWRYPDRMLKRPVTHDDHDHIDAESLPCPVKYCIVPQGPLGRLSWEVHRVRGLPFRNLFKRSDIGFFHCARVTTDWNDTIRMTQEMKLRHDPPTRALLDRAYSNQYADG